MDCHILPAAGFKIIYILKQRGCLVGTNVMLEALLYMTFHNFLSTVVVKPSVMDSRYCLRKKGVSV
jgi:hypothetical protein